MGAPRQSVYSLFLSASWRLIDAKNLAPAFAENPAGVFHRLRPGHVEAGDAGPAAVLRDRRVHTRLLARGAVGVSHQDDHGRA